MKYTIAGFNQAKIIEYGLDLIDAYILRWYVDFLPKLSRIENSGRSYYWVKYQQIIEDLPCLGINNREVIARRFNKFIEAGIMDKFVNKDGGSFTCFTLNNKYLTLVEGSTEKSIGIDSKVDTPIDSKVDTKDSSIKKNSSIKLNKENIKENLDNILVNQEMDLTTNFTNEEKSAIKDWLGYKKEKRDGYKPIGIKVLITKLSTEKSNGCNIIQAINESISNNWKGIIFDKGYPPVGRYQVNGKIKNSTYETLKRCNSQDFSEKF